MAYLGNATGNRSYGSLDASYIAQAAVHLMSFFPAYPDCDPAIIAGDGPLGVNDAIAVAEKSVYLTTGLAANIPALPLGVSASTPNPAPTRW